jgi:hypothetical protein
MSNEPSLSDFFKELALEKEKAEAEKIRIAEEKANEPTFSDFFKLISEEKNQNINYDEKRLEDDLKGKALEVELTEKVENINENALNEDLLSNFKKLSEAQSHKRSVSEAQLGLFGGDTEENNDDPLTPLNQEFVTHEDLAKHYKTFIQRVQHQMSTIGGGGETKLRKLDDIDRSTIADNKYLKYNAATGKFVFSAVSSADQIASHIVSTTLVTTASYTASVDDHYIGVNYSGTCTITLPSGISNGEQLVIKDESGSASINPIVVSGTVDNDAGGFTLQINNGSISLIYRNGWRIV